jgi:hypothetical protein
MFWCCMPRANTPRQQDSLLSQDAQQRLELGAILDRLLGRRIRGGGPRRVFGVEGRSCGGARTGVLCG